MGARTALAEGVVGVADPPDWADAAFAGRRFVEGLVASDPPCERGFVTASTARRRSATSVSKGAYRAGRRAIRTTSAATAGSPSAARSTAPRRRRLMRFRSVAWPTRFVIVKPRCRPSSAAPGEDSDASRKRPCAVIRSVWKRRPPAAARKSERRVSRPIVDTAGPILRLAANAIRYAPCLRRDEPLRPTASCGRGRAGRQSPCGRPRSPSVRESRDGVCGRACSADRFSSRRGLRWPRIDAGGLRPHRHLHSP